MTDYRVKELRSPSDPATLISGAALNGLANAAYYDGTATEIVVPGGGMKRLIIEWDLLFASAPTDFRALLLYVLWNHRPSGQTARFASGTGSSYLPIGTPLSLIVRASTSAQRDSVTVDVEGTSFVVVAHNNTGVAVASNNNSIVRYQFVTDVLTDAALS